MKKILLLSALFMLIFGQAWAAPNDMSLARKYYKDEVYKTAADHYRKFLEENPSKEDIPDARLGLARSLTKINDLENASRTYQDFVVSHQSHVDWAEANYELAQVLQLMGSHTKSSEFYYNYSRLKNNKKSEIAMYNAAAEAYAAKEYETSKNYCIQYLESHSKGSNRAGVLLLLGKVSGHENDWKQAKEYLQQSIALNSSVELVKAAQWFLARTFVNLKKNDDARKEYLNVLGKANAQDSAVIVNEYSKFLFTSENYSESVKFLSSRSINSLNLGQQLYLSESHVKIKEFAQALKVISSIQVPNDNEDSRVKVAFLKAEALIGAGDRAEGIQIFLEEGKKGNSKAYIKAGEAYAKDAMYQQAIQAYFNAIEYLKDDSQKIPLILKIAGIYENDLKRYSVARSVYEDFSKNYPSSHFSVDASMGIARSLQKEDKLEESAKAYQRVMEDFPLNPLAKEARLNYNYITNFKVKNNDAATNNMLLILEKGEYPEKNLHIAEVLEKDLKLYEKAYEVYQRYIKSSRDTSSTSLAFYRCGRIQELLSEKAFFEKEAKKLNDHKSLAIANYNGLKKYFPTSEWRDDAEFRLLELSDFNLDEYMKFTEKYTTSNCLPEVLLRIADSYKEKAENIDPKYAAHAVIYYHQILNSGESDFKDQALLGAASSYIATSELGKALELLNILINKDEIDRNIQANAWLLLGEISFVKKDYVEARKNYKEVLYRFSASTSAPEALFMEGKTYDMENDNKKAINTYLKYIDSYSDGADVYSAYMNLSKVYEEQFKLTKAIEVLAEYLKENKEGLKVANAWERVGSLYEQQKAEVPAVDAFREAIRVGVGSKDYLFVRNGDLLLQLDQFDSSQIYFEKALKVAENYRDSAKAFGGIGPCMIMRGKTTAFRNYQKTFKKKYDDEDEFFARIVYYEGRHLMEIGEQSRARKRFNLLANRYEETSWAGEGVYYLGSISFKKGKYKAASKDFKEYIDKNLKGRSIADAYFKLGSCYYQMKEYRLAVSNYHKALEFTKASPLVRYRASYNAAIAHEKLGEWNQSGSLYSQIYNLYPDYTNGGILVSAGFAYYNASQFDNAKVNFKQALGDSSNARMAEAHYWYAKSLDKLNDVDNAVAEYLKVNYLYPNDPMWGLTSLFDVGQIYERSGMKDKARKMYERIVTQDGLHGSLGSRAAKYLESMDKPAPKSTPLYQNSNSGVNVK